MPNFLNLPIEIRNEIYKKVLALPQPLHLFQDPGCPVESFIPGKPYRWLALLYTNRQISEEARASLYRFNSFTFQEVENGRVLEDFINSIGHFNAGSLSHLCFDFPATESMHGETSLRESSLQRLQLLQKECGSLAKLEIFIYSRNSKLLIEQDSTSVREVLSEINRQFGYISSLRKIIVRVYSGSPAPSVKEFLQGLGWIVLMGDK
jgi:hypothetical protein